MTKWLVKGIIIGSIDRSDLDEIASSDIMGIERGLLWPIIGWEVTTIHGFHPVPNIVYMEQVFQPPCWAWVDVNARDRNIITTCLRMRKTPNAEDTILIIPATWYQTWHKKARQIIDMDGYWTYLKNKQKGNREEFESYKPNDDNIPTIFEPVPFT